MNIADRYVKGINNGVWRDSHIKIEGKAVAGLQTSFLIDWYSSRKEFLASDAYYPVLENKGDNLMQLATSGPVGPYKDIHLGDFAGYFQCEGMYLYPDTLFCADRFPSSGSPDGLYAWGGRCASDAATKFRYYIRAYCINVISERCFGCKSECLFF